MPKILYCNRFEHGTKDPHSTREHIPGVLSGDQPVARRVALHFSGTWVESAPPNLEKLIVLKSSVIANFLVCEHDEG